MYQETSAIGRRRNLLHEKPVDTVAGVAVGESEIQRPLYLPAELLRFSFCLPARRSAAGIVVVQSIHEVRIDEMWFPGTTAILFQDDDPLLQNEHPFTAHTYAENHQLSCDFADAMIASPGEVA